MISTEPLTRRKAWQLAWPMFFANAAVPLAGVVDTAVIGLVGTKADLGGVALGNTLFNLFYWSFYFLRMGSTGLAAQAVGARDDRELQRILVRSLGVAAFLGLAVLVFRSGISRAGFSILQGTPDVETVGSTYFMVRSWGAPGSYLIFGITGWLLGVGNTRGVLMLQTVFSLTNIALAVGFVLGLDLGVRGVGAATAIAEYLGAAVGVWYVLQSLDRFGGRKIDFTSRSVWDFTALRRMIALNVDMMVRSWALLAAFSWFANSGARQGAAVLAGNHVLLQIVTVWAFVLDGYAFTTEVAVGRAFGARSLVDFRNAIRVTTELAIVSAGAFLVITLLGGPWLLDRLISDAETRESALRFLPYCAAIPLVGTIAWQLDGVFIGATRSAAMRNATIIATVSYLAADYFLVPRFGGHGMWMAFVLFYLARGAALMVAYPSVKRGLESPKS